jgi:hypothetical protein
MSIAVLIQVHEEVRRLAIAGGSVAPGDFRLKKLVAPLEQSGAKAPVFARIAQAAAAVVDSTEKTASAALLELATLVNAVLYTQGETGVTGDMASLETTDLGVRDTQTGARVLKPLLDALSTTGSGRIELVRDAVERGSFRDLRLVKPALKGLDDPYPEIADLIAQKVLPMYGKAIVPELRTQLDLKERGGNLHRLRLLHKIDPEGTREIVHKALEEGSKEIRVAAIECLDTKGSDLGFLLEQVKAKAKDVRAAALRALGNPPTAAPETIAAIKRAIDGADIELCIEQLRKSQVEEIREYVLAKAEEQLASTLTIKEAKQQGAAIERMRHLLQSLEGRTEAKTEAFLLRCFDAVPLFAKIKSEPSGQDFNELLARVLARSTQKTRELLAAAHKTLSSDMLHPAFEAARETMTPAAFYKEFSPSLAGLAKRGKKGAEYERAEALQAALMNRFMGGYWLTYHEDELDLPDASDQKQAPRELDPRWLDAAVEVGALDLVCHLARPGHAKTENFLLKKLDDTKSTDEHGILKTMVRINHPEATDVIIESLKKQAKSTHYYVGYWYGSLIASLPRSSFAKIDALLPTLPEKMVDQLMESVMELKNKQE